LIQSSAIKILKTFSKEEFRSFEKFADSPYFNTSDATGKLVKELRIFHPGFNDKKLTKEFLFSKVYPGEKYREELLRKLLSNILQLTGEFLKIHGKMNSPEFEFSLLREYSKRALNSQFMKSSAEILKQLDSSEEISISGDKLSIYAELELIRSNTFYSTEQFESALEAYNNYSEKYFVSNSIKLLRIDIQLDIDSNFFSKSKASPLAEFVSSVNWNAVIESIEEQDDKYQLGMYYRLWLLYKKPDDLSNFKEMKDLFLREPNLHERTLLKTTLIALESNCIINYDTTKDESILKHLSEIYEFTIKNDLFERTAGNFMPVNIYRNYLLIFIRMNPDMAKELAESYTKSIAPDIRDDLIAYSQMMLCFHNKDFYSALNYLNCINFVNFTFKLDLKAFNIKIHYELGNYEQVFSAIDSFKHYVNDENKSERFTEEINKFLKLTAKLVTSAANRKKGVAETLSIEMKTICFNYERKWLEEKVLELLK
jgi:hypothetical protein